MTSQGSHSLLVFVLGIIACNVSGKLSITPLKRVIEVKECNHVGDVVLNITVGPAVKGDILNVHLTEKENCLNLTQLNLAVRCSSTCTFPIKANSVLNRESDCKQFKLIVSYGMKGSVQITKTYNFILMDTNDHSPQFENRPYQTSIPENFTVNTTLPGLNIHAKDDDTGPNAMVTYELIPSGQNSANIGGVMSINNITGKITLRTNIDYEKRSFYQYSVIARDGGTPSMNSSTSVWIEITDIQDTDPVFTTHKFDAHVKETAKIGQSVMQVTAQDGDLGIPNKIIYEIKDDVCKRFKIDRDSGVISVNQSLLLLTTKGNCLITVIAKEELDPSSVTTQNVTIFIDDVNNNGPEFNENVYNATVSESAIIDHAVKLDKPIQIVDKDQQIENRKFKVTLKYLNDTAFTALKVSLDESSTATRVSLLVNDASQLDYEKTDSLYFKIIAEGEKGMFSSSANVRLSILPSNEYKPRFGNNYTTSVLENATVGKEVIRVSATDQDRGSDGNITYRLYGSNGFFQVGKYTGIVTVAKKLDYETVQSYQLTVEAIDGGNQKGTAELNISVNDTNDEIPKFTPSNYEGKMTENNNFTITVKAKDNDKAGTPNSEVLYEIVNATENLQHNFTINATTGEIRSITIDYEKLNSSQIVLVVSASDQGKPQLKSTANVTITVKDANDNSPVFTQQIYYFNVSEDVHNGYNVGNVSAKDADRDKINNEITYNLLNGTEKFRINALNGSVYILGKLDKEYREHYFLKVEAIDRGTPMGSDSAFLDITVTDVNDEIPKLQNTHAVEIYENMTVNSSVVTINATDADSNPRLKYRIYSQNIHIDGKGMSVNKASTVDYFRINATTGEIFVNEILDRETAELISLGIEVRDLNAVVKDQISKGEQVIKILDVNDNCPKFLHANITVSPNENLSINSTLTSVIATDADKNDSVTYRFEKNYEQFRIDKKTGKITLAKKLDRETNSTMSLIVLAIDSKPTRLTSTATIVLDILDSNDNSPVFSKGLYNKTYDVNENVPINHEIVTVHATDADTGINAEIRYSLFYRDGGHSFPICINYTSGCIYVCERLDRETTSSYIIEVKASDMRGEHAESRTGSTWIKINVTDDNDNLPIFGHQTYSASVQEDKKPGQSILQVRATDRDIGKNGKLSFSLEGDESALFKINSSNGIISVKSSLLDQVNVKRFVVMATDHGSPSSNTTANVTVNITDINNHPPRFNMMMMPIDVSEDTCPGASILHVAATDDDFYPQNNRVTYKLNKVQDYKHFKLDENSGLLILEKKLDRETKAIYQLEITASDSGKPTKTAMLHLRINAINVDDEPPVFRDYPAFRKSFSVVEGNPNRVIGKVTAVDEDPNSKPCYKIIADKINNDSDYFKINNMGEIRNNREIDYEKRKHFEFAIETHDCNNNYYDKCDNTSTSIDNILSVTVNVTDANDNSPRFNTKSMRLAIQYDIKNNSVIENLMSQITDADENPENKKNFFNISDFERHGELVMQKAPFVVKDGKLKTNQLFNAAKMGYIQFLVLAFDSLGQNDTAIMKVYVVGKGNQVMVNLLLSFEKTQEIKKEFCRDLGMILGNNITIVAGKIEPYQESDGTYNKRKTSMYIYGIKNGEIMSAEKLRSLIDFKSKELSQFLNTHSVIHVGSLEQKKAVESSKEKVILFAVIAVLTVSLFAIVLLFYGSSQRYKRKLKAANIDVHSNKQDFEKWIVPGSNVHALGESNPIYNKEINNVMSESDKVSLNSLDMNEVRDSAIFVDPYDEQEIAMDFIDDTTNEQQSPTTPDHSQTFLDNVIKEREAEMNKKKQNTGSMSGSTNMALSVNNLETTDV